MRFAEYIAQMEHTAAASVLPLELFQVSSVWTYRFTV